MTVGGGEQPRLVSALTKNPVRFLDCCDAGPIQVAWNDGDTFLFGNHFQPVIESPDHQGARWRQVSAVFAFSGPALDPFFHRFRHGNRLWNGEANGRVQMTAAIGNFLGRADSSSRPPPLP